MDLIFKYKALLLCNTLCSILGFLVLFKDISASPVNSRRPQPQILSSRSNFPEQSRPPLPYSGFFLFLPVMHDVSPCSMATSYQQSCWHSEGQECSEMPLCPPSKVRATAAAIKQSQTGSWLPQGLVFLLLMVLQGAAATECGRWPGPPLVSSHPTTKSYQASSSLC